MIKELVLASMMSFGVGIGTMQHEPMQKVEPYTIVIFDQAANIEEEINTLNEGLMAIDGNINSEFKIKLNSNNTQDTYFNNVVVIIDYFDIGRTDTELASNNTNRPYYDFQISPLDSTIIIAYNYNDGTNDTTTNPLGDMTLYIQNKELYNWYVSQQMAQEGTMGQQIITNIKSGLGMIGDLASEFLIGFTALFWNSTQQQLTVFGIFSLVMLGIAITMAVVKLCMNLIRSNTGA